VVVIVWVEVRLSTVTQLVEQSALLASVHRTGSRWGTSLPVRNRQRVTLVVCVCVSEGHGQLALERQADRPQQQRCWRFIGYLRRLHDQGVGEFEVKPLGGGVVVDHIGRALASRVVGWRMG
jgi:hypothetical protein